MGRRVRIEYPGALYHVLDRDDRRESIYGGDADRELFLRTLGEACGRTGWRVHAYVLMSNHYHLMLETPEPNLVKGMHWLQRHLHRALQPASRPCGSPLPRTPGEACAMTGWRVHAGVLRGRPLPSGDRDAGGEPGRRDGLAPEHLHPALLHAPPALGPALWRPLQVGAGGGPGLLLLDAARLRASEPNARRTGGD